MFRNRCVIAGTLGVLTMFGVGDRHMAAQTSPSAPAVSVRRLTSITSGVVTGDFNGDGIVDLASTAATATAPRPIVVALGRGDSTFNTPRSAGIDGSALAAGDFNEDGKLDLIADDGRDDAPLRLLPGNGDGTFAAPVKIGGAVVAGIPFGLAADFNSDGNLDVAVGYIGASDDGGVLIYQGYGDGTFSELIGRLDTGISSFPAGGVVADLNNDGKPDVLVANHVAQSLSIFVNQGGFNFTASDRQMARAANDVTAADVNRDGKLDVIVAEATSDDGDVSYTDGSAVVYLGNGDGTIAAFGRFNTTGRGPWRVVTGDFNRDGILDIATANRSAIAINDCGPVYKTWDSISIITGRGDGTFTPGSTDYSIGNQQSLDDPRYRNAVSSLVVANVNRDEFADLVSDGVVFTTNSPDPNWAPTVTAGPDQTFNGTHTVTLRAVGDDVDQDVLRYVWDSNTGMAIPQVPNPCITVPSDGTFTFVVTAYDLQGHQASATVHYTFTGGGGFVYPSVTVTAPASDEVIPAGQPYTIRWSATAGTYPIQSFDVRFSSDFPANAPTAIPGCTNLPPSATSCVWNNPNPPTERGVLQVDAQPTAGPGSGTSVPIKIRDNGTGNLTYGWSHADVGHVGATGSATHDGFQYEGEALTVSGSGADIWGTADEFHYVWQPFTGDFQINVRVNSLQNVNAWTKAGIMMRTSATDASSPHASMFVSPSKGTAFQRRTAQGGATVSTAGPAGVAPVWLRMVRIGTTLKAYYRKNPTDLWTLAGQETFAGLGATVNIGLAVSSHADGALATAKFAGVHLSSLPVLTGTAIGAATGSATTDGTSYTVKGSGADIWGTGDNFFFLAAPIGVNQQITARVRTLGNTDVWAKAGVMIRESLAANAKQADAIVSPSKGIAFQYRSATGGPSASAEQSAGAAPIWLRVRRSEPASPGATGVFDAYWSKDGVIWHTFCCAAPFTMAHDAFVGIAVTSHRAGVETTAVIDDVWIDR